MSTASSELMLVNSSELVRQSTDVAGLCKEIVTKTALNIQGKKYVKVEGWQSIATAHGCAAGARDVERVDGGFKAIGELRRISDGTLVATAEGFVGEDEPTWFGGEKGNKKYEKRPDYAIRAMAQTRAISRVCRSAFAHVVVLMDAGLSTTPAEEVPFGGFQENIDLEQVNREATSRQKKRETAANKATGYEEPINPNGDWRDVKIHFGKNKGVQLGELNSKQLHWYAHDWVEKKDNPSAEDRLLIGALARYVEEAERTTETLAQDRAADTSAIPFK